MDFYIKKDSELPVIESTLSDSDGAIDLSGASVDFRYRPAFSGTGFITNAATVSSATSGIVQYAWGSGDVDTLGVYNSEWVITFASSKIMTLPADRYLKFEIVPSLG